MFKNIDWKYLIGCTAIASSFIATVEVLLFNAELTRQFLVGSLLKPFLILLLLERLIYESNIEKER